MINYHFCTSKEIFGICHSADEVNRANQLGEKLNMYMDTKTVLPVAVVKEQAKKLIDQLNDTVEYVQAKVTQSAVTMQRDFENTVVIQL